MSLPVDCIPEPREIMLGCRPWTARPVAAGRCPVCGSGVREGHDRAYCGLCDSMSPRREAQIAKALIGMKTGDQDAQAVAKARAQLRRHPLLSERERRRIWNGNASSPLGPIPDGKLTNLAKVGRDWLREIEQEPDWTLVIDRFGREVGRYEVEVDEPWG